MNLTSYLNNCAKLCEQYMSGIEVNHIQPQELKLGTLEYFKRGGKRLRPAILMLCAGALGGEKAEREAVSAACAVELFHTFTLIHDDIIDNDPTRRGGESVHVLVSNMFKDAETDKAKRDEYGRDIAILSGDMLHALSVKLMLDTAKSGNFSPKTVLKITSLLENECLAHVLKGEALDTKAGLIGNGAFSVGTFQETYEIMDKKTAMLFSFAATAGGMLGLDSDNENDARVRHLSEFARLCGIAFQIQDDVLGICADEKKLGKPTGSDIREGKRTLILQHAYQNASDSDKRLIEKIVGNKNATPDELDCIKNVFIQTGAVENSKKIAEEYIKKALWELESLTPSHYLNILKEWALFMSERTL